MGLKEKAQWMELSSISRHFQAPAAWKMPGTEDFYHWTTTFPPTHGSASFCQSIGWAMGLSTLDHINLKTDRFWNAAMRWRKSTVWKIPCHSTSRSCHKVIIQGSSLSSLFDVCRVTSSYTPSAHEVTVHEVGHDSQQGNFPCKHFPWLDFHREVSCEWLIWLLHNYCRTVLRNQIPPSFQDDGYSMPTSTHIIWPVKPC